MRAFLWFVATIAGTLLVAALLAYPLYLLVHPLMPAWWFDKIATRLWQLLLLLAIVFVVRRLRLTTRRDFGYGAPRPRWLRQFGFGLVAGLATMLPVTISMLALGVRVPRPDLSAHVLFAALGAGALSGLVVGFVEETFFRGLMQGAVSRELRRPLVAVALVSLVYASVHFLAGARIAHASVTWRSGLELLAAAVASFASPAGIIDAWLALVAVGLLLGACAVWTGSIAVGVGLHAGWVCVMRATIGATRENPSAPLEWLISPATGYTGWLVLGWTLGILAIAVILRDRFRGWRRSD
ncbi:MAG TPA: CPBP family glutamic-type intramembrane protease [Steroidobacteraceae bacterium]|nr:CPBP family glutamic-type intramembrane protease [Steroidobacteraceae bacterium]